MNLPIFPEGGLASSVITTVWVGVFILCFFNLRFGWVLSGLVVPGYLVPLLIVKPMAALVITVEAIMTYAIVWVFSEKISRGRFPSLFGRDRFMGLILASIAVRLAMDGYILPQIADWLADNWDRRFDWESNLQSFGLVILSLMANQFWKPGLARGLVALVVVTGLTLLVVRYGLMELTNFRISGVSYLYEGLASSILASPKAYIILVLTALIASHMNVRYGWDFSGILIPALIALQWYQPGKIVSSFLEAIVIYFIARLLLKTPMLANATMEGGRKLLLFFNISFAYKLLLGHAIVWLAIDIKTTDTYGFGYLLATLLAIKAHDKNIFPRLTRSTLQVSLAGAVLGNIVGFALAALTPQALANFAGTRARSLQDTTRIETLVAAAVGDAHLQTRQNQDQPLSGPNATALANAVELFEAGSTPEQIETQISDSGWRLVSGKFGRIGLQRSDGLGRDLLIYDPAAQNELAMTLPNPTSQPGMATAAFTLFTNQSARWLVITTPPAPGSLAQGTILETFREASALPELAIYSSESGLPDTGRSDSGRSDSDRSGSGGRNGGSDETAINFSGQSAAAIDVAALRKLMPELRAGFDAAEATQADVARLRIDPDTLARLRIIGSQAGVSNEPDAPTAQCRMAQVPLANQPPLNTFEDLAFLRFEVVEPLLANLTSGDAPDGQIAAARMLGFSLTQCRLGGAAHWRLASDTAHEGTYLFAANPAPEKIVTSFSGGDRYAARAGAALYRRWQAGSLLIAPDELTYRKSQSSTFGVVNQSILRVADARQAMLIQLRSAPNSAPNPGGNVDLVIARDRVEDDRLVNTELLSLAREAGLRPILADRSPDFAGYEAGPNLSLRFFNEMRDPRYAVFWLRDPVRRGRK